jgi:hypothetical protein
LTHLLRKYKRAILDHRLRKPRAGNAAIVCMRFPFEIPVRLPEPLKAFLERFECAVWLGDGGSMLFACFSDYCHPDYLSRGRAFAEAAINNPKFEGARVGFAHGPVLLTPDPERRRIHDFPDGDVCGRASWHACSFYPQSEFD